MGPTTETIPDELPPAQEARRFRGLTVPLVAAAVVLGIGYPLTALAVSQVGGAATSTVASASGRARLTGAVTFDGPARPISCTAGTPRVLQVQGGAAEYSIIVSAPAEALGRFQLGGPHPTFVAVSRLVGGSQTWTSLNRAAARGEVTVRPDRSISARFSGLEPSGGGAEGVIDGTIEARCD